MTKKEAMQILAILKAAYPNSYKGMSKADASGTVAVWCMQFSDISAEIVLMAVNKLISVNPFPPSISEIKQKISALHWEAYDIVRNTALRELVSPDALSRAEKIYEATKEYKYVKSVEPTVMQMINDNNVLLLSGGDGNDG